MSTKISILFDESALLAFNELKENLIAQVELVQPDNSKNKGERYGRVPRLSDSRYSAKGTKGKWRYVNSKARMKCATYPRSQYMVMWAVDRFRRYGR